MLFKNMDLINVYFTLKCKTRIELNKFCFNIIFQKEIYIDKICNIDSDVKIEFLKGEDYVVLNSEDVIFQKDFFILKNIKTTSINIYCTDEEFDKLSILTRKYERLYLASRSDGVACRFQAMLNAMYFAKINNCKFGFIWYERKKIVQADILVVDEDKIFDKLYLDEYSYTNEYSHLIKMIGKNNLDKNYIKLIDLNQPLYMKFDNICFKDYHNSIFDLWKDVNFSINYQRVVNLAKENAQKLNNDFTVVHIRNGDNIYSDRYFYSFDVGAHKERFIPLEIAFEIICFILKQNKNVVIFNPYYKIPILDELLCKFLSDNHNVYGKFFWSREFVGDLNEMEMTIYDLFFMSYAQEIYGTPLSRYGLFASLIGKSKFVDYTIYFDLNEQFFILQKNKKLFENMDNRYKYVFYYYMYSVVSKLEKNDLIEEILLKANSYFPENLICKNILLGEKLKIKKFVEAEKIAKDLCLQNIYFETMFIKWKGHLMPKMTWDYCFKMAKKNTPYIAFIAFYLSILKGDDTEASKFLSICIEKVDLSILKHEHLIRVYLYLYKKMNQATKKEKLGAKIHIRNHLSYKLGKAIIFNSKSLFGIFRMPFVISYIVDQHRLNKKLELRNKIPLRDYLDYKSALNIKKTFTYKLGEAFIEANRNWYKGGYIKFLFVIYRLKKEFKYKL
ncbi:TPA: hypothetical protein ACHDWQ_000813 [Campylobacter jejuni]